MGWGREYLARYSPGSRPEGLSSPAHSPELPFGRTNHPIGFHARAKEPTTRLIVQTGTPPMGIPLRPCLRISWPSMSKLHSVTSDSTNCFTSVDESTVKLFLDEAPSQSSCLMLPFARLKKSCPPPPFTPTTTLDIPLHGLENI